MNTHDSTGRRRVLKGLAAGAVTAAMPGIVTRSVRADVPRRQNPAAFRRALVMPPEMTGQSGPAGLRQYVLRLQQGSSELVAGLKTSTWGFNGPLLGPTLRIPQGRPIHIRIENTLKQPSTVHWHGAHVPGVMDGGPQSIIEPGATRNICYTLNQPGGTLWYHPHLHTYTGGQVYAGLAGMLLLDDGRDAHLGLPHRYGINDIPVVLQDRRLDEQGRLLYMDQVGDVMGMKGDRFLVNGIEQPHVQVGADWLRLRLLNGSNARFYNLAFEDDRDFFVIAGDAGLLPEPARRQSLLLSAGERAEIMVDLKRDRGKRLRLCSKSSRVVPQLYNLSMAVDAADKQDFALLELQVGHALGQFAVLPDQLAPKPRLDKPDKTRNLVMTGMIGTELLDRMTDEKPYKAREGHGPGQMSAGVGGHDLFAIDGEYMDMDRINIRVKQGHVERWLVTNPSMMAHPFHIHGTSFVITARNGASPEPHERGWKDVVNMRPGETVELLARFDQAADEDYPYMYHCHILEHEDNGMMGQFTVG